MKKFVSFMLSFIFVFSFITVKAENTEYSLLNGEYVRLLGRGEVIEGSRTFNWPNAGFEFKFSGNSAEVYADVSIYDTSDYNGSYFTMAVYDGNNLVRTKRMKIMTGWNTIYTAEQGDPKEKTIMLVRSSEACKGTLRMSKIRTDEVPSKTLPREKHIEFIGDSYTAGYGNSADLSEATVYCAQNTDNWNSYTGMVARHYGADNTVIAHQGKGVYANRHLENTANNMAEQFEFAEIATAATTNMSTKAPHDFSLYQPQIVSVWLGTNDGAAPVDLDTFKIKYEAHVDNVRSKYPNASIICVAIKGSKYHDTIKGIVDEKGAQNKFYMLTLNKFTSTSYSHPDVAEDERIANQFIAKIDSIPGIWDNDLIEDTELLSLYADYNTNTVTVTGKTPKASERVSALVLRPGKALPEIADGNMIYANQTQSDKNGEYEFSFYVEKMVGKYSYYMGTDLSDSFAKREFAYETYIPMIMVQKDGEDVTKMDGLITGDTLDVTLSGFDHEDGFLGMLAIAQYKEGRLLNVSSVNVSQDSVLYGSEVKTDAEILDGADCVKVIFINKLTATPLIGAYVIK